MTERSVVLKVADCSVELLGAPDSILAALRHMFRTSVVDTGLASDVVFAFNDRVEHGEAVEASEVGVATSSRFFLFDRHGALAELPQSFAPLPWRLELERDVAAGFFVPNVLLPVLHLALLRKGATLVHAGAVEAPSGQGVLLPAWGGVGKTSTLLTLAMRHGFRILGDDLSVVSTEARLYPLVRTVNVLDYNLTDFPELRRHFGPKARAAAAIRGGLSTAKKGALKAWGSDSLLAAGASRLSQLAKAVANAKIPIEELQQGDQQDRSVPLRTIIALQRSDGAALRLESVTAEWIAQSSAVTIEDEFEKVARGYRAARALDPSSWDRVNLGAEQMLLRCFGGVPCYRLTLPSKVGRNSDAASAIREVLQGI